MAKYLVIVESPAKVKTIKKFLGANYEVEASNGHVRDFPKSQFGIDVENDFEPKYITIRGKGELLAKLRKAAKKADKIYLATDPDREGEAISWHLMQALKEDPDKMHRITFNEITKTAVKDSLKHARGLNMNLVDAQQARRVLDRVVGYGISPLLWAKIKRGLSAGRVQSVALRMICDRENEIDAFIPEEYWTMEASLNIKGEKKPLVAKFYGDRNGKIDIKNAAQMQKILDEVKNSGFSIESVKKSEKIKKSPLPFTTSTLQQEAAKTLNMSTKRTMNIAQQLYEGVEVKGQGTVGLVTYIRTDSVRISAEAKAMAKQYIEDNFGSRYAANNIYTNKKKDIQDAHEAIRPSRITLDPESIKDSLTKEQYSLYKLIWTRFLASQMAAAVFDGMQVNITNGDYCLKASGSKLVFDGYQKIYAPNLEEDKDKLLPEIEEGEELKAEKAEGEQKFTEPPARFTEASLVKELEERNIGRPSTYAPIIATILERKYIVREKKVLVPTDLGFVVTGLMEEYFKEIVDAGFTAEMEDKLDDVEAKDLDWKKIIRDFYGPFKEELDIADKAIERVEIPDRPSDEVCEVCGKPMVIKSGRFGDFLACSGYPECKNTKAIVKSINVKCPDCGRDIVAKRGRSGKIFYGCSGYPECTRAYWYKPTNKKCPECGELLLEKHTKTTKYACSNAKCGYKE